MSELLKFLSNHNEDIKIMTLKNDHENLKLTVFMIQKYIVKVIVIRIY